MNNHHSSNSLPIDPMLAKPTRYDAASAIAVVRKLVLSAPVDLGPKARAALEAARSEASALTGVVTDRERLAPTKPLALAHTNAWSALHGRLAAAAQLPKEVSPEASVAQRILDAHFHGGLSFVVAAHEDLWVDAERRIGRFDSEGRASEIDSVAGPAYLQHVRATHAALGEALGLGHTSRPIPDTTALADRIAKVSRVIARYALVLMSEVDVDDPSSVARFQIAMAPLVVHRASVRAHGDAQDVAEEAQAPDSVPPLAALPPITA